MTEFVLNVSVCSLGELYKFFLNFFSGAGDVNQVQEPTREALYHRATAVPQSCCSELKHYVISLPVIRLRKDAELLVTQMVSCSQITFFLAFSFKGREGIPEGQKFSLLFCISGRGLEERQSNGVSDSAISANQVLLFQQPENFCYTSHQLGIVLCTEIYHIYPTQARENTRFGMKTCT